MSAASTLPERYTRAAERSSESVIREYSSSFGLASRLLHPRIRADIRNIYGLVRIADEVVDGAARDCGLDTLAQRAQLDRLEGETIKACDLGFSTNPIVHSFAVTARSSGIGRGLIEPFFASMRRDLNSQPLDAEGLKLYVYGSAEVVGLMCLCVFVRGSELSSTAATTLEAGARALGSAFQKVNFVRDLGEDWLALGRSYFPDIHPPTLSEAQKDRILDEIDDELRIAAASIPLLPSGCRTAVATAHGLFSELSARLRRVPAQTLLTHRERVATPKKLVILVRSLGGRVPR